MNDMEILAKIGRRLQDARENCEQDLQIPIFVIAIDPNCDHKCDDPNCTKGFSVSNLTGLSKHDMAKTLINIGKNLKKQPNEKA